MIREKIVQILNYSNKKQTDMANMFDMSKQSFSNKMKNERFTYTDIIRIAEMCDCEVLIADKQTGDVISTLTMNDCRKSELDD